MIAVQVAMRVAASRVEVRFAMLAVPLNLVKHQGGAVGLLGQLRLNHRNVVDKVSGAMLRSPTR